MTTSQGIKLDEETRARLKRLAEKRQRSPHWLMRAAIESYLDREEAYEREKGEDMARWDHYLATGMAVENDKAKNWLNDLARGKDSPWQK
jgi:predicted transcriptional regulator